MNDKILFSVSDMNGNIFFYNFKDDLNLIDVIKFGNNI